MQEIKDLKSLREYFVENSSSSYQHWAFKVLDDLIKKYENATFKTAVGQSTVEVTVTLEGEGDIAKFDLLACELPPIGHDWIVNTIKGEVIQVEHDLSEQTARVWIQK